MRHRGRGRRDTRRGAERARGQRTSSVFSERTVLETSTVCATNMLSRVQDVLVVQPDVGHGREAIEPQSQRSLCGRCVEAAPVPPVIRVEITRLLDIPPSGRTQRRGHRHRPVAGDPLQRRSCRDVRTARRHRFERAQAPTIPATVCGARAPMTRARAIALPTRCTPRLGSEPTAWLSRSSHAPAIVSSIGDRVERASRAHETRSLELQRLGVVAMMSQAAAASSSPDSPDRRASAGTRRTSSNAAPHCRKVAKA